MRRTPLFQSIVTGTNYVIVTSSFGYIYRMQYFLRLPNSLLPKSTRPPKTKRTETDGNDLLKSVRHLLASGHSGSASEGGNEKELRLALAEAEKEIAKLRYQNMHLKRAVRQLDIPGEVQKLRYQVLHLQRAVRELQQGKK